MAEGRAVVGALVAAVGTLTAAAPSPAGAVATLGQPPTGDPSAPLVAAAALLAWGLTGWLAVVLLTVAAGRLPGWAGRCAGVLAARVAPHAVRHVVELALGLTVAAGAVTAPYAIAEPTQPLRPPLSLDWPGPASTGAGRGTPALDWPVAAPTPSAARPAPARPAPPQPAPPQPAPPQLATPQPAPPQPAPPQPAPPQLATPRPAAPAAVVVRLGDTLWGIAADHLPAGAAPAAVAQAWPAWWSANRAAIGSDPDLILPGTSLVPPAR